MRSLVHYMQNAAVMIALTIGTNAAATTLPVTGHKLILHGIECESGESCLQSRAVLEEAARILREDSGTYIVQTSQSAASSTAAFFVDAGVDARQFRIEANDGTDVASCEPAIAALTCR